MSSKLSWISRIFKSRNSHKASEGKCRPFSCQQARPRVELLEDRVVPTTYTWLPTAAGSYDWNSGANWSGGSGSNFPNAQGDVAIIQSALVGNETINLNQAITVGTLDIGASSGTNAFTIAPSGGSLTLSVSSGSATVAKTSGGADQITAGLTFSSNVIFNNSLSAPNTLSITSATTGADTVTVNSPTTNTGEVDFTSAGALSSAAGIAVDAGTLGINSITLTSTNTITIGSGAFVNSSGEIQTTANGSSTYSAITGSGTLQLTSTSDSASSPDIYFNSNDNPNTNANYGTRIASKVNLGSSQRYIWGVSNHNSVGEYGSNSDCVITGAISGSGGITFTPQVTYGGPGAAMEVPLYLDAANSFTGMLEIQRGSVYLGNASALNGNNVLLDPASGNNARLYLYGHSASIGTLSSSGAGTAVIANSPGHTAAAATLTINQASAGACGGAIVDVQPEYSASGSVGSLSLVTQGAATLTLSGTNTYSGTTTVSAGALSVGADANLGSGGNVILNGGTLLANTTFTLSSGRSLAVGPTFGSGAGEVDVTAGQTLSYSGSVANNGGAGTLIVGSGSNTGILILGGSNSNSATTVVAGTLQDSGNLGAITVSGGTLNVTGTAGAVTVNSGVLGGSGTVGAVTGNATINPGLGAANILNTGNLSFGAGAVFSVDVNSAGTAGVNYDQLNVTGSITLTGATLQLNVGYSPTVGDSYTIIHNVNGTAINTTFTGLSEGSYFVAGGHLFQITYQGNSNNDVVVTAVAPPVYYVEADGWSGEYNGGSWTGVVGQTVPDADPVQSGNQTAVFGGSSAHAGSGYKAFTSVNAALAQIADDNAVGATLIDNGGVFVEDVVINRAVALTLQYADSTFNSLADTVNNASIALNGVTLTTGGDNASTQVSSNILGTGNLFKNGTGAWMLTGNNSYTGTTEVSGGAITVGSATALGVNPTVTVDSGATLTLNGNSYSMNSLAGAGIVQDANASPVTLTVNPTTNPSFSGVLQNGTGAGSLSLAVTGGALTLSGTNSTYTGSTTVSGATLNIASLAPGGSASSIGASTNAASSLVLNNGATLIYITVGSTANTDRGLTLGSGVTLDVTDPASTVTFTGSIAAAGNSLSYAGAGTLLFPTANALSSTGNIFVSSGTLGIGSITLSSSKTITINANAILQSSGEIQTTADPNATYAAIAGIGTLQFTSTTDSPASPDFYFNSNDAINTGANYGSQIASAVNLGSSQRYIWGNTNHNSVAQYGTSADCVITGPVSGSGGITFIAQASFTSGNNTMEVPLYLTAPNTFTGPLVVTRGSVYLGSANALNGNDVTFNPAAGNNARLYLYGNSVTIGSLSSSGAGASVIANSPGITTNPATLTVTQAINGVFGGALQDSLFEDSPLGTPGPLSLVQAGPATLTLTGTNTYTGPTTVSAGALSVGSDANLGADPSGPTPGNIILDGGTLLANSGFTLNSNRGVAVGPTTGSGEIDVANGDTLTYAGAIADNGSSNLTVNGGANAGSLVLSGGNTNATTTLAAGTLQVMNTGSIGAVIVNGGLVQDDGTAGAMAVNSGILSGTGTTGAVYDNGTINPGDAPGILNTGSLSFGSNGVFHADVNGTTAGVSYDQLNVTGSIDLTGATLQMAVGYVPTVGDSYTLIHNVNGGLITGTFTGLNEGALFYTGGQLFQITYHGNSNNDVVVTAVTPPTYYVEADGWSGEYNGGTWTGIVGQTVPDANPVQSGNQPAVFGGSSALAGSGYKAFTSVNAALAQVADDGVLGAEIVVNGGTYAEDVNVNEAVTLLLQYSNSTFNSLADTVNTATVDLSGITLTAGGDNNSTQFSSNIEGTGNLIKSGSGTMTLAGDNVYGGTTEVSQGVLRAGSPTGFSANSAITVDSGTTLRLNGFNESIALLAGTGTVEDANANSVTLSTGIFGSIFGGVLQDGTGIGTLALTKTGAGVFILTASNTYSGGTSIAAGTLQLGNAGTTGAILGNVADNGTLDFNRTDPLSYGATISGSGGVTQDGSDILTLTGANSFASATVNHGILKVGAASGLGTDPTVTVNTNGDLQLNGNSYTFASLAGGGTVENANATPATLSTGSTDSTFNGILQDGTGGGALSLTKIGGGTFTVGAGNSFTGVTTVGGGVLAVDDLANGGSGSSIGASTNAAANLILQGGGTLEYTPVGSTVSTDRSLTLGVGGGAIDVNDPGSTLTFTGTVVGGVNPLTTGGLGTLVFSTANALTTAGNIAVTSGTLSISSITLTNSNIITVDSGAVLMSSGTIQTTAYSSSSYAPITGGGTLRLTSTTDSASSPDIYFNYNDAPNARTNYGTVIATSVDLGSSQRYVWGVSNHNGVGWYFGDTDCVISGNITGSGGITFVPQVPYSGSGAPMEVPLYLTGTNTFTGPLNILRGSVYLSYNGTGTLNGQDVSLSPASGNNARFFLFGQSVTIGNLNSSGAGTSVIANSPGATTNPATLTVTQTANGAFGGAIQDLQPEYSSSGTVGPLSLMKQGAATLILSGTNSYTGTTTVTAGALSVGADANLGNAGNVVLNGGTLLANSTFTLNSSRGVMLGDPSTPGTGGEIDVAAGDTLTYDGVITDNTGGNDNLTVGSAANTGTLILNGNNTFTGTLTVNAGTLAGMGSVGTVVDDATINPGAGTGAAILNTGALSFSPGGNLLFDLNGAGTPGTNYDQINVTGAIDLMNATLNLNLNYAPAIGDSFTIIHNVTGAPILNHFAGLTEGSEFVVNGHLFQITYQGNGNHDVVITADAATVYYVEADGWLGEYNGGSWTGIVGQTVPDADPVQSGNQPAVFGGSSALAGSGRKAFTSANAALTQIVDDNAVGAIVIANGGTFNENVVISQAIALELQYADSTFNSLADTVSNASIALNGVTLNLDGAASTQVSSKIFGTGSLAMNGSGTFTLAGANLYSGGTLITSGAIAVGNSGALGSGLATVDAGATLQLNGNSLSLPGLSGAGTVNNAAPSPLTLNVSATTFTSFAGAITNTGAGALSLVVTGAGTFTLSGNSSTYTGSTTVGSTTASGTTLDIAALANGGSASSIGASTNVAANLVLNNGSTLEYTTAGSTTSTDRSLTLGTAGVTISVTDAASTVTFTGTVNGGNNGLTTGGAGTLVFFTANALNSAGNITVNSGALGIGSITLSANNIITINGTALVQSSGTISTIANGNSSYQAITGSGTLQLTSTTNSASTPDIYFNANDNPNSNANYGSEIATAVSLGSSQRYIWGIANHNAVGVYGSAADCVISGPVSGNAGITFVPQVTYGGPGASMEVPLYLIGANTFTGPLNVLRGSVYLGNANALDTNQDVSFNPAAGNNANLFLFGQNATIGNLNSSGAGTTTVANSPGNSTNPSTLTVNQTIAGTFGGSFQDTTPEYSNGGTPGSLSLVQNGPADLTLTGTSSISGSVAVAAGTLTTNGSFTAAAGFTVANGSTLNGTGTDDGGVNVSGTIEAGSGASTGILTADNLSFGAGGTVDIQLNGTTAGSGYDQLSVGNVDLTGATLAVNLGAGFNPAVGTVFEIISNTGSNPVAASFAGLPEGSVAMIGGLPFTVSYVGGDGNDVTLTRTSATVTSNPVGPIVLGTSVTFTATISNAGSANTGTVSFYYNYGVAGQFQIGGAVNLVGGSATSAATTALPVGSDTITAVYTDGAGSVGILGTVTIQVTSTASPPTITAVEVNENIPALYQPGYGFANGAQRSMVDSIVYTFSEGVNILSPASDPNVFTISTVTVNGITGTVPTLSWALVAGTNDTEWAVTFSGAGVTGNSIADGAYQITVTDPQSITAVSDNQTLSVVAGVSPGLGNPDYQTQQFVRLFGDINGNEIVNAQDNAKFKLAIAAGGYNAAFDYDANGAVNALDNAHFKHSLAAGYNFLGFTQTI